MTAKYDVTVKLVGEDGNAFYILGAVSQALKRSGVSQDEIDQYVSDATQGDYDALLRTTLDYVRVV